MSIAREAYAKAEGAGFARGGNHHFPTPEKRRLVRNLAGLAVPVKDIARMIEIAHDTLNKHYAEDLEAGRADANLKVSQSLFRAATREHNPNVVAAMFWLKNRAGWKDIGAAGQSGPVTLHLLAAQEVGKQIIEEVHKAGPPTIDGTTVTNSPSQPASLLDAPPPLE